MKAQFAGGSPKLGLRDEEGEERRKTEAGKGGAWEKAKCGGCREEGEINSLRWERKKTGRALGLEGPLGVEAGGGGEERCASS